MQHMQFDMENFSNTHTHKQMENARLILIITYEISNIERREPNGNVQNAYGRLFKQQKLYNE